ncbi:MAG: hypothetical protein K6E18_06325 [Lachnospiraceae bacterium]|nr:hypothetical protein [Lachnospiraceae bacterium]
MNEELKYTLKNAQNSRERMQLLNSYREPLFDDALEDTYQGTDYNTGVCSDMPECGC